jgi:C_GCAxxG_C_C family probable redox protein
MDSHHDIGHVERDSSIYLTDDIPPGSKAKIIDAVSISAFNNNRAYEGCARCVLAAINEHLRLTSPEGIQQCISASTALSAGVARMGETCGALLGAIMALGLEFGSDDMSLFDRYDDTMRISRNLFRAFTDRYGTATCADIQEKLFGRRYDFFNEEDREAWYKDGGLQKCPSVCAAAAGLAAEIILDYREKR